MTSLFDTRRLTGRFFYLLVAFLAAYGTSRALPPTTTTISDTIYRADGSPASGTLLITWSQFTTSDQKAVAAGTMNVPIAAGGAVNVALAPNAGATPAGSFYKVTYKLDDGTSSTEYWTVPATSPTTISAIRSTVVPASMAVQVVSRTYVDGALAAKATDATVVHKTGDTMTGPLTLSGDPSAATQAATKNYVDTHAGAGIPGQYVVDGAVYTNIQAAVNAAGTSGSVLIPSNYGGSDSYTNPNHVPIVDLRSHAFQVNNLGSVRLANAFSGGDLGAKINAADADLGASTGEIWVYNGGTISTQVVLSGNHTLRLLSGTYTPAATVMTGNLQAFPIVLNSNSSMICSGWDVTLLEPTQAGIWTIVSPFNAMNTSGMRGTDSNISISGCHFKGAHGSFNSAPTTVPLGNCVHCSVTNNWFDNTTTLGTGCGGNSSTGNHADGCWITDNLFTTVASQNIYVVNGKDVHIARNIIRSVGQVGGPGVSSIDLEPNAPTDIMENIEVADNLIDNIDSVQSTSNGITVQNANLATYGPISVHGNVIRGGNIDGAVVAKMSTGIVVNSSTRDVEVSNNYIRRTQQSGIVVGGDRNYVNDNKVICVGSNSNGFPGIQVLGTNSIFNGNMVVDPGTCGGSDATIAESGGANTNFYMDNVAQQLVTVGAASRITSHIDNVGTQYLGNTYFNGTLYGGIAPTALSTPSINSGGSGGATVGGGTLPNGTYGYKVTAVTQSGETAPSAEVQKTTTGGQNAVSILINGVTGASSYRIYGRTAGGPWNLIATTPAYPSLTNHTLTYIDNGTVTPSGAIPAADNSGQVKAPIFTSSTANPAAGGQVRLAQGDSLKFRNNANSADLTALSESSDVLQVGEAANGINIPGPANVASVTASGTVSAAAFSTGGDSFAGTPRIAWGSFLPGNLSTTWTGAQFTTKKGINVVQIDLRAKTAPAGCTTFPVVQITDGTTPINVTLNSAAVSQTVTAGQNYAANATVLVKVSTAGAGCTTNAADVNVTVQYKMQ